MQVPFEDSLAIADVSALLHCNPHQESGRTCTCWNLFVLTVVCVSLWCRVMCVCMCECVCDLCMCVSEGVYMCLCACVNHGGLWLGILTWILGACGHSQRGKQSSHPRVPPSWSHPKPGTETKGQTSVRWQLLHTCSLGTRLAFSPLRWGSISSCSLTYPPDLE